MVAELMTLADHVVSGLSGLTGRMKFYDGGLGDIAYLRDLPERLVRVRASVVTLLEPHFADAVRHDGYVLREGHFISPYQAGLPPEGALARVQWIMPEQFDFDTPIAIHFSATGDEGFFPRRVGLAVPLARAGIGSLLLENPYYGGRRPAYQRGFSIQTLSDQFKMNEVTVLEGLSLLRWLRAQGFTRLGVTGVSMGGSMAATVGAWADFPLAIAPCLAPFSPRPAFLEGVLGAAVDWDALRRDYTGTGDVRDYVREVMDLVDLRRIPPPPRCDAVVMVAGSQDAYVLPYSVRELHAHWHGSQLRWVNAGHVTSVVFHHASFRTAVVDAFAALSNRDCITSMNPCASSRSGL